MRRRAIEGEKGSPNSGSEGVLKLGLQVQAVSLKAKKKNNPKTLFYRFFFLGWIDLKQDDYSESAKFSRFF